MTILETATIGYDFENGPDSYTTDAGNLKNIIGNTLNGTFNIVKGTTAGWYKRGANFNGGTKATFNTNDLDWLNVTGLAIINPNSFSSSPFDPIVAEGWNAADNGSFRFEFGASGVLRAIIYTSLVNNKVSTSNTGQMVVGDWSIVGFRWDGTTLDLRQNGIAPSYATFNSGAGSGNLDTGVDTWVASVGWHFDGSSNNYLDAKLGGAWLWDSALSNDDWYTAYEELVNAKFQGKKLRLGRL